jgi:thiamine-monophosphate kinase
LPQPERKLIERIQRLTQSRAGRDGRFVVRGIGDDCAILRLAPGHHLLVTTDLSIEDVHFRRKWHPPQSVGHRCLARGLSDIAAMAGEPLACFLSLGLPAKLPQRWVDEFFRGFQHLARRFRVPLAGGDTSAATKITADIVVAGQTPAGKAILRSGARPGDRIYATGELGASAAVLKGLFAGKRVSPATARGHFYPEPRLAIARQLRLKNLASAMIDLSDGLSVDLGHICQESSVTATINAGAIPIARGAGLELALHGGEDYELLFTAGPRARIPVRVAGVKITEIGRIHPQEDYPAAIRVLDENGKVRALAPRGWEHFRKRIR